MFIIYKFTDFIELEKVLVLTIILYSAAEGYKTSKVPKKLYFLIHLSYNEQRLFQLVSSLQNASLITNYIPFDKKSRLKNICLDIFYITVIDCNSFGVYFRLSS